MRCLNAKSAKVYAKYRREILSSTERTSSSDIPDGGHSKRPLIVSQLCWYTASFSLSRMPAAAGVSAGPQARARRAEAKRSAETRADPPLQTDF